MNFKVFISVNIHTVALSWNCRESEHPTPAPGSMLHLVWDTRYIGERSMKEHEYQKERKELDQLRAELFDRWDIADHQ
jgi:hypothetical protein